MILALITALTAAGIIAEHPSTQEVSENRSIYDPIFGPIPSSGNGPDQLYARLRAERRDSTWATRTEQNLRDYFSRVQFVGGPHNPLRVTCRSSLCEVAGTINVPANDQSHASVKSLVDRTMQELQGKEIHDSASRFGLDDVAAMFGGATGKRNGPNFLIYFRRH